MADAISPCHHQYVLATDEQTNKQKDTAIVWITLRRGLNKKHFQTSAAIEDTDSAITAVMYLVVTKHGITLSLYPDAGHRVVKDLVVLNNTKATVVYKDPSILSAPNLVAPY